MSFDPTHIYIHKRNQNCYLRRYYFNQMQRIGKRKKKRKKKEKDKKGKGKKKRRERAK